MKRLARLLILVPFALAACDIPEATGGKGPVASDSRLEAAARAVLTDIQPTSIARNREYCGSIVQRANGSIYTTGPEPGDAFSCGISYIEDLPSYRPGDRLLADYHIHSAYSRDADSEVPSTTDLDNSRSEGVPGYVATPGGRFWFISPMGALPTKSVA